MSVAESLRCGNCPYFDRFRAGEETNGFCRPPDDLLGLTLGKVNEAAVCRHPSFKDKNPPVARPKPQNTPVQVK